MEVFLNLKQWKTTNEKQIRKKIKHLSINNGLKFFLSEFNGFYKNEGIVRHPTVRKMS